MNAKRHVHARHDDEGTHRRARVATKTTPDVGRGERGVESAREATGRDGNDDG